MKAREEVDVVAIGADTLKDDVVSFLDCVGDFQNCVSDVGGEQGFPVLHGKDEVVVRGIDVVVTLGDAHASILR